MGSFVTGLIFLVTAAAVYAYNTESHTSKITFGRFGLNVGETETVAILLSLGIFFLGLGAWRWLRNLGDDDESGGS